MTSKLLRAQEYQTMLNKALEVGDYKLARLHESSLCKLALLCAINEDKHELAICDMALKVLQQKDY